MALPPIVSVVIPVHNQEKFIGRCIRSALNQKYPRESYEVIVVDDASTDRTRYALELFGDEIRLLSNKCQLGLPGSLNAGIKIARGRFLVRMDADDYVHSEYLNVLTMHMLMNPYMDAVACDYHPVDDTEQHLEHVNCLEYPIGCGIIFRIEHLIELGLYDEQMLLHEDKDLMLRFLEKYRLYRVALPLYRYRKHKGNMTNDSEAIGAYLTKLQEKYGKDRVEAYLKVGNE